MLKLKPSMRTNKRYLLIRGKKSDVEKAILDYLGLLGWAKAEPVFVKSKGDKVIISVNRKEIDKVIGSFAIVASKISIEKVSGTLKGLGEKRKA